MILLLRLIPFAVGLLEAVIFWQQRLHPSLYPWLVAVGVVAIPIAAACIAWNHVGPRDLIEKMTPTLLLIAVLSFALLLVEGSWQLWLLIGIAGVSSFLSLEVLFLMAHNPAAYPVNGISRVNISYVPLIVWYAVSTSSGLLTFIHTNRAWHLLLCLALGVLLFRTTGHPGATKNQNRIWVLVGACVGLEVGLVSLFLPISMEMQGFLAAAIFCAVLRVRRYLYDPKPSVRVRWSEAVALFVVCVVSLSTSKWF